MIVSQMMSRKIETCRPFDSMEVAAAKMWERDIGCLPVLDDEGRVIGMVTDRDACMAAFTQGRRLAEIPVETAMGGPVFSCSPTDRIEEVEAIMKAHQIRRVPVVDEERHLLGLITMNDLVREAALELRRTTPDVPVRALVSTLAGIMESRHPIATPSVVQDAAASVTRSAATRL